MWTEFCSLSPAYVWHHLEKHMAVICGAKVNTFYYLLIHLLMLTFFDEQYISVLHAAMSIYIL